jgi:hypothetical protein
MNIENRSPVSLPTVKKYRSFRESEIAAGPSWGLVWSPRLKGERDIPIIRLVSLGLWDFHICFTML